MLANMLLWPPPSPPLLRAASCGDLRLHISLVFHSTMAVASYTAGIRRKRQRHVQSCSLGTTYSCGERNHCKNMWPDNLQVRYDREGDVLEGGAPTDFLVQADCETSRGHHYLAVLIAMGSKVFAGGGKGHTERWSLTKMQARNKQYSICRGCHSFRPTCEDILAPAQCCKRPHELELYW